MPTEPVSPKGMTSPSGAVTLRQPERGPSGTHPGRLAGRVEVERGEVAQVQDDATVGGAVAGRAVTAGPNGQLEAGLPRQVHDDGHVASVGGSHDDRRTRVDAAFARWLAARRSRCPRVPRRGRITRLLRLLDGQAGGNGWRHDRAPPLLAIRGRRTQYPFGTSSSCGRSSLESRSGRCLTRRAPLHLVTELPELALLVHVAVGQEGQGDASRPRSSAQARRRGK